MQGYDILMVVVLVLATVFGAYKGIAWQLASLGSIIVSYIVAVQFRGPVAELIGASPPWNKFLAMLILYLVTSFVIWLGFRLVSKTIDQMKLKSFDHQIGALFGAAKGVVLCVVITLFAVTLLEESQRRAIIDSRSGHYISRLLSRAHPLMPEELNQVLEPYVERLDGNSIPMFETSSEERLSATQEATEGRRGRTF